MKNVIDVIRKKTALVLDTDVGTDDAMAFLFLKHFGINPDHVIAVGGNTSNEGAIRNAVLLTRFLNIATTITGGHKIKLSKELGTFHGKDGLANISRNMIDKLEKTSLISDEYGHIERSEAGFPVKVARDIKKGRFTETLKKALSGER